jgi:hypothetical protein
MRTRQFWGLCVVTAMTVTPLGCARQEASSDDAAVAGTVRKELAADRDLAGAAAAIQVTAHDGIVTLSGRVPSEAAKREAAAVADDVDGVDRVQNELGVAIAGNAAETTRIRSAPAENRPAPPPAPNAAPSARPAVPLAPAQPAPQPAGQ